MYDYLSLPLLKGGSLGLYGTAPIVHAAAMLLSSSDVSEGSPEAVLEARLGATIVEILPGIHAQARGFISSHVSCPECSSIPADMC